MREVLKKLQLQLQNANKVVFMGIGEEKLRDDGFGPYIISELLDLNNERFLFINAHVDPMSRTAQIIDFNPSHLVLFDTCTLDKSPGTVAILERENIQNVVPISSHTIPIHVIIDLLIEQLPSLRAFMIGVVPESLEGFTELKQYKKEKYSLMDLSENEDLPFFEINLTSIIKTVADKLINLIKNLLQTI